MGGRCRRVAHRRRAFAWAQALWMATSARCDGVHVWKIAMHGWDVGKGKYYNGALGPIE